MRQLDAADYVRMLGHAVAVGHRALSCCWSLVDTQTCLATGCRSYESSSLLYVMSYHIECLFRGVQLYLLSLA